VRCRGCRPRQSLSDFERLEAGAVLADLIEHVEQVARGPSCAGPQTRRRPAPQAMIATTPPPIPDLAQRQARRHPRDHRQNAHPARFAAARPRALSGQGADEAQAFAKVYGAAKRRALRASDGGNSARASPSLYLTPPSHLVTSFCGGSQNDDRLSAAADTDASTPRNV
jgi:hypothetical protein